MHGSRSKIPSKKSRQAALCGGINSGVKGLNIAQVGLINELFVQNGNLPISFFEYIT
jgi:hypothetical protein